MKTVTKDEAMTLMVQLGVQKAFDLNEFHKGVVEELKEHSNTYSKYGSDIATTSLFAASIAVDHLREDPYYYSRLEQMNLKSYRMKQNQCEGRTS
jgi:hypothetical protein